MALAILRDLLSYSFLGLEQRRFGFAAAKQPGHLDSVAELPVVELRRRALNVARVEIAEQSR